jgi:integrase
MAERDPAMTEMLPGLPVLRPVSDNYPLSGNAPMGLATGDPLVDQYLLAARAANTRRAYAADLADFQKWGGTVPAGADQIARYIAWSAQNHRPSTLRRRLAALAVLHRDMGHADPTKHVVIQRLMQGIDRRHGIQVRRVAPLLLTDLIRIAGELGPPPVDRRDAALLLVGFFGALRRSELVQLRRADLKLSGQGIEITIRRSKTDQLSRGRTIKLPSRPDAACPRAALEAWLQIAPAHTYIYGGMPEHHLDPRTVARIVKRRVAQIGLDPVQYSGHSLRAGFATSAALAGWNMALIASQTGHRSQQVLAQYVRTDSRDVPPL